MLTLAVIVHYLKLTAASWRYMSSFLSCVISTLNWDPYNPARAETFQALPTDDYHSLHFSCGVFIL